MKNSKIKILHVIGGLERGGAEHVLLDLISHPSSSSFDHYIISLKGIGALSNEIELHTKQIYNLNITKKNPLSIIKLFYLIFVIRKLKPVRIQGWMYIGNIVSILFSNKKNQTKVLWSIHHSLSFYKKEKIFPRMLIKISSIISFLPYKIIYVSKRSKIQHLALGFNKSNAVVIYNGIKANNKTYGSLLRSELNINNKSKVICMIARYHPIKNHLLFIETAERLLKLRDDIYFVLAGQDINYNNNELVNLIKTKNILEYFYLLGKRDDINNILYSSDLMLNTSHSEAFSISILEAMLSSLPVFATDVGDNSIILNDSKLIIQNLNPTYLSTMINEFFNLSKIERNIIGNNLLSRVKHHFPLENTIKSYNKYYIS